MKLVKAVLWYIAGLFIVPFLNIVTLKGAKKWRYLDSVYGNKSKDGLDGDENYQARVKDRPVIAYTSYGVLACYIPVAFYFGLMGWFISLWEIAWFFSASLFLRRFRWYLRNPLNNLLRGYGPNGIVESVEIAYSKRKTKAVAVIGGDRYWMIDYKVARGFHIWLGYKLMDDLRPEINSRLKIGEHFENQMLIWIFKSRTAYL